MDWESPNLHCPSCRKIHQSGFVVLQIKFQAGKQSLPASHVQQSKWNRRESTMPTQNKRQKCLQSQEVTGRSCTCWVQTVRSNADPYCDSVTVEIQKQVPFKSDLLCWTICLVGPVPAVSLKHACRVMHAFSRCRPRCRLSCACFSWIPEK